MLNISFRDLVQHLFCLMFVSLRELERNYKHYMNFLEPAYRIYRIWPHNWAQSLNDNILMHMQAVYSLQERRYVGGERGAHHQICFVSSVLESSCRINTGAGYMFCSLCAKNTYLNFIGHYIVPVLKYRLSESCTYVCSLGSFLKCWKPLTCPQSKLFWFRGLMVCNGKLEHIQYFCIELFSPVGTGKNSERADLQTRVAGKSPSSVPYVVRFA